MAARQWRARGGPTVLGRVVPGVIAGFGVVAFAAVGVAIRNRGLSEGLEASAFFLLVGLLAAWLVWKTLRTVWLIMFVNDAFLCFATAGHWVFEAGEIVRVSGDAYNQFILLASPRSKVWVWAQIEDHPGLLAAIRRANPSVVVDPLVERDTPKRR
ncbi:MAG TPA: hypothetical protein VME46_12590 [Acidimicrobiales bacterium]|nr:hypothetical protein [Acidimicrobiales bacterium]